MNKTWLKRAWPHAVAILVFLLVAVFYCRPVLSGQVLKQEDIQQWKAMSKSLFDYKEQHGHFPLWTNSMFSGMPAYQIAMESGNKVSPGIFYYVLTLGLPKPISFFFLACVCFYILAQVLRVRPLIAAIGALAYAYATYNPVLIATGHDTKFQSIAFLPAFLAGVILVYERRYLLGAAMTALFTTLLISMNHMQIVYYAVIIAVFLTIAFAIRWIRRGEIKHMITAGAIVLVCGILGVLTNAVTIFTTQEAARTTIRGGSELGDEKSDISKNGLSKDYAFSYSMYKTEPFVMMVPKMYGGSDQLEVPEEESKPLQVLQQNAQQLMASGNPQEQQAAQAFLNEAQRNLGAYWGGIGGTAGPPYVGAIICFLTLIGFFIADSKHKWWILGCSIFAILMSWGGYFDAFNSVLLKVLPGYNKFRAPSVTIVIPTLLFCMMATLTLEKILLFEDRNALWDRYRKGLMLAGAAFAGVLLVYLSADFLSDGDKAMQAAFGRVGGNISAVMDQFLDAVREQRKSLFMGSFIRSLLFAALAAAAIWMYIRKNVSGVAITAVIGIAAFIDVIAIDSYYFNSDNFKDETDLAFNPTPADLRAMNDPSFHRVFDFRRGLGTMTYGAPTAYFHNSVGGYHPAKLSIYQDLISRQFTPEKVNPQQLFTDPGSMKVLNMLNTKYIIFGDERMDTALVNTGNLGAAWFPSTSLAKNNAQEVMAALDAFDPRTTAVVFAADAPNVSVNAGAAGDTIQLLRNANDSVFYQYSAAAPRFAVFSEIFYPEGWIAMVDGKELPIVRTNYVLRGVNLPAGQNKQIQFVFRPKSYYNGVQVSMIAGIIVLLIILAVPVWWFRNRSKAPANADVNRKA